MVKVNGLGSFGKALAEAKEPQRQPERMTPTIAPQMKVSTLTPEQEQKIKDFVSKIGSILKDMKERYDTRDIRKLEREIEKLKKEKELEERKRILAIQRLQLEKKKKELEKVV